MSNLNLRKPLRGIARFNHVEAKTFNSDGHMVVWIGDRVFPIDKHGRAIADVNYGANWNASKGELLVENVPEPSKDYVILYKDKNSNEYEIDQDYSGQLFTKECAEDVVKKHKDYFEFMTIVRVK